MSLSPLHVARLRRCHEARKPVAVKGGHAHMTRGLFGPWFIEEILRETCRLSSPRHPMLVFWVPMEDLEPASEVHPEAGTHDKLAAKRSRELAALLMIEGELAKWTDRELAGPPAPLRRVLRQVGKVVAAYFEEPKRSSTKRARKSRR